MHPNEDIVTASKHFVVFCGVGNELVSPQGEPQVGLDNNDIISADNGFNWWAGPGIITTSHYCN